MVFFLKFPFPDSVQDDVAVYFKAQELASIVRKLPHPRPLPAIPNTHRISYSFHDVFAESVHEQAVPALLLPPVIGPITFPLASRD